MRALALVVAGALACGPTDRDRCFDAAAAAAERRVDRECPGSFDSCPTVDDIIAELQAAQAACP